MSPLNDFSYKRLIRLCYLPDTENWVSSKSMASFVFQGSEPDDPVVVRVSCKNVAKLICISYFLQESHKKAAFLHVQKMQAFHCINLAGPYKKLPNVFPGNVWFKYFFKICVVHIFLWITSKKSSEKIFEWGYLRLKKGRCCTLLLMLLEITNQTTSRASRG